MKNLIVTAVALALAACGSPKDPSKRGQEVLQQDQSSYEEVVLALNQALDLMARQQIRISPKKLSDSMSNQAPSFSKGDVYELISRANLMHKEMANTFTYLSGDGCWLPSKEFITPLDKPWKGTIGFCLNHEKLMKLPSSQHLKEVVKSLVEQYLVYTGVPHAVAVLILPDIGEQVEMVVEGEYYAAHARLIYKIGNVFETLNDFGLAKKDGTFDEDDARFHSLYLREAGNDLLKEYSTLRESVLIPVHDKREFVSLSKAVEVIAQSMTVLADTLSLSHAHHTFCDSVSAAQQLTKATLMRHSEFQKLLADKHKKIEIRGSDFAFDCWTVEEAEAFDLVNE